MAQQAPFISTPVAIVAAGALIGVGLFLGLRTRHDAPSEAPTGAPAASPLAPIALGPGPTAAASTTAPTVSQPAPATSAVDTKTVTAALKAALDQNKKMIVDECVTPSLAKKPTPAKVNLTFNFSVDANGKQLARGISEDRETSRPEVTECVQRKLPALSIAAPGTNVFVENIVWVLP